MQPETALERLLAMIERAPTDTATKLALVIAVRDLINAEFVFRETIVTTALDRTRDSLTAQAKTAP